MLRAYPLLRVYLDPPEKMSMAMQRVASALRYTAPEGIKIVRRQKEADLSILHVIGWEGLEKETAKGPYAIIQYCMRTTEKPHTSDWLDVWKHAAAVWSYYDLRRLCQADHVDFEGNLLVAPLGVEQKIFHSNGINNRSYVIFTSGYLAEPESVESVAAAVERVGGRMIHLGPNLYLGDHVESYTDIDDIYLAALYRQCRFVSGLRRGEGFELPAAEGLLCGCRPILYDQPHYRLWYDKWGLFIPEESPEVVESALVRIFKDSLDQTVTESEIRQASERFHWESVTSRFWERILFGAGIGSVGAAS
jgi:glycosyltransferase involved in cell wall biosynthesis